MNYFANSEDPNEMQHNAAFHQGLHCLYCSWNTTVDIPIHKRDHNDCQQLITKSHGQS